MISHAKYLGILNYNAINFKSIPVEYVYSANGSIYEVIEDGWLRIYSVASYQTGVLTSSVEEYDSLIPVYTAGTAYTAFEDMVKVVATDGSPATYWLCTSNVSVSQSSNVINSPGGSAERWMELPAWLPAVSCYSCSAMGDADMVSSVVFLPVHKGDRFLPFVATNNRSDRREIEFNKTDKNTQIYLQFLPHTYSSKAVGLKVYKVIEYEDSHRFRFDTYKLTLTGLPLRYQ